MTHALITFLGRTPRDETEGYRKTTYQFPNGTLEETAVLGWNLAERLRPDLVIILGTSGSMWDFLAESAGIGSKPDFLGRFSCLSPFADDCDSSSLLSPINSRRSV